MNEILLLAGIVIIICILVHRLTFRLGVPSLLAFLALGMCFGVDGILHISFNNYRISEVICSISLIFIMFYGGFGTNFQEAVPLPSNPHCFPPSAYCLPPDWWVSLPTSSYVFPGQKACSSALSSHPQTPLPYSVFSVPKS